MDRKNAIRRFSGHSEDGCLGWREASFGLQAVDEGFCFSFGKTGEKALMARYSESDTLLDINRLKVWKH